MTKKVVKTEMELKQLLEDTRRMKREIKISYNPQKNVIINGTEILNFRNSGFPNLQDLINLLEYTYLKTAYKPVKVVVEENLLYLFEEKDINFYEKIIAQGYNLRNHLIQLIMI